MLTPRENETLRAMEHQLRAEDPEMAQRWEERAQQGPDRARWVSSRWVVFGVVSLLALAVLFLLIGFPAGAVVCAVAAPALATLLATRGGRDDT